MLIRDAEIDGRRVDVRIRGDRIESVAARLEASGNEPVFDARGGALLPGLHDHHAHLFALAAAAESLHCGPPHVVDARALATALAEATPRADGWVRGVAYHDSVAGALERDILDGWQDEIPVRIQHRSGALWIVNSAGAERLGLDDGDWHSGIERDSAGRATGRLFRSDDWLRERIDATPPDLASVGATLARYGVTGITEATVSNDAAALAILEAAVRSGALRQQLLVMGRVGMPEASGSGIVRGPVKALLDEPRLPPFDDLCGAIGAAHRESRGFAVHCVTRAELALAVAAFDEAGARPGDRIEHASVAPPEWVDRIAALPLTVVTQPHFIAERGDSYLADVEAKDCPWLYRGRGWLDAGVPLGGGTDAPFGHPDPWRAIASAVTRRTAGGQVLADREALTPEEALSLFTTSPDDAGGPSRRIVAGAFADLCLLDRSWAEARTAPSSERVAATWCRGALAWNRTPRPERDSRRCGAAEGRR